MGRLLLLAVIVVLGWKLFTGRWPWQAKGDKGTSALARARRLLGVSKAATREDIVAAHRRLVAQVHPDRGGSSGQVHEANAARDLLLTALPLEEIP
jgi:DnaJ family protein C protein 19